MALFPPKNPAPAPAPIPMPAAARPTTLSAEDIARARNIGSQIRGRFAQTLVGQDNLRESLITTLVAGGHILIESVPGLAKTTAAQTLNNFLDFISFSPFSQVLKFCLHLETLSS